MDRPLVALVLAGGVGSRLYPASRSDRPKQFRSLVGDRSLLTATLDRASFADRVVVSTRESFAEEVTDHVAAADPDAPVDVVVEPAGKDTGPALVFATHRVRELVGEAVVCVLPSDHFVGDDDAFAETLSRGARVAVDTGALVTFGVEPTRPDTGYGYLEPGPDRGDYAELAAFHEKPDAETAARYVEGGYYWNAGIFAWTPEAFLEAAADTPLEPLVSALDAGDPEGGFAAVDPVSVDYAVMERTSHAAVVPAAFAWDDLGSWDALERVLAPDEAGNVVAGDAGAAADADAVETREGDAPPVATLDAADNVVATDGAHVSLVGVEGLAVVAWDDRVLVVPKAEAQRVRDLVDRLKGDGAF